MPSRAHCLTLLAAAAGILLLVLAYLPGTTAPFYLDDWNNIAFNEGVHFESPLDWSRLRALPAMTGGQRKLSYLSFGVNWALTGGSPSAMRWTNILIHSLNAVLAFILFTRVLKNAPRLADETSRLVAAGAGAMMWALHPIQVASVSYVVQRMNLLAAFFSLLGTLAFLRALDVPGRFRPIPALAGSLVCLWLGFMCKEWVVLAPLGWLLLVYRRRGGGATAGGPGTIGFRGVLLACLSLGLLTALAAWSLVGTWPSLLDYSDRPFGLVERLMTQGRALCFYLSLLVLPLRDRFALVHPWEASSGLLTPPTTLLCALLVAFLLVAAFMSRRRHPLFFLATAWFFAFHLLESGILRLELVFEHRNYFPSLFVFLAFASGVQSLHGGLRHPRARHLLLGAVAAILAVEASQTALVNRQMADRDGYIRFLQQKYPDSARLIVWRTDSLIRQGKYGEAEGLVGEALAREDRLIESSKGRGAADILLARSRIGKATGDFAAAVRDARLAASRIQYYPPAQVELAALLLASNRASEAESELLPVVRRDPDFPDAWYLLAIAYHRQGKVEAAREAAIQAARHPSTDPRMTALLLKQVLSRN